MITFLLYFLTALATGWQLSQRISMGVWGKLSHPLEAVAFLGAVTMLGSAYAALFFPRRAVWFAIIASVSLWVFYAPAAIATLSSGASIVALFFFPVLLLGLTSIHVTLGALMLRRESSAISIVLQPAPKGFRRAAIGLTGLSILTVTAIGVFFVGVDKEIATPVDWTINHERNRPIAKMTFRSLSGCNFIETDSSEVIAFLQEKTPDDLIVRVILTYDFGKVRSMKLNHAYLESIKFHPFIQRTP